MLRTSISRNNGWFEFKAHGPVMVLRAILKPITLALIPIGIGALCFVGGCASNAPKTESKVKKANVMPPGWERAALHRAADYLNAGLDCLNDSLWFEAGENLDSAMSQLMALDSADSLDAASRIATKALKDTVQVLMLKVAGASGEVEELNPVTDLTDADMGEASDSSSHAFDSLSNSLDYSLYDLPLPRPLPGRVQQAMAYFTGPGRKVLARWLNRKSRYEAFVRERLEARGMPRDLFYLAMVESGLNPRAYSHARAAGMWQFISGTGRRYGLMDDYWIDPRRDIVAATDAALSYLQTLFKEFGDWHMAMASYNCGENRVRRELQRDSSLSYWQMNLPGETRFYVPKILAAMILGHEPERFGFQIDDPQAPLAFDTVTITDCLPLKDIARAVGASDEDIMDLNPSLRRWCTPPNRKSHVLYLPVGTREAFITAYAAMDKNKLMSWKQHQVVRGDNLGGIAGRYGVSLEALKSVNRLKNHRLHIGQTLIIPVPAAGGTGELEAEVLREAQTPPKRHLEMTYRVRRGDNLFDIARRFGTTMEKLRALNGLSRKDKILAGQILRLSQSPAKGRVAQRDEDALPPGQRQFHVVQKGETLYGLSRTLGVEQQDLIRWNQMKGKSLQSGQRLVYIAKTAKAEKPSEPTKANIGTTSSKAASVKEAAPESSAKADRSHQPSQYYVVREGDTLWDISQRFQSSMAQIREWNQSLSEVLRPGTRLRVR